MLADKETYRDAQQQTEWILSPNFQKLILGYIRPGTYTRKITRNLEKLERKGKNQSFPPYFDLLDADLAEILTQLERKKFIIHVRSASLDDNLWVLTQKGSNYLNPQEEQEIKIKTAPQEHEIFNAKTLEKKRKKRKLRKSNSERTGKQKQTRLREQKRLERARVREERRIARLEENKRIKAENREKREQERQKRLREREEVKKSQRAKRDEEVRQERERIRVGREEVQRRRREETERIKSKYQERLRTEGKKTKKKKRAKDESIKRKRIEHKTDSQEIPRKPNGQISQEEKQHNDKRKGLEETITDALKRLRKKRYKVHLPLFRESDGQGVQIYLSPNGKLCYKPKEQEYIIDLDVASDVYDVKMICESIENALSVRGM